MSQLSAGELKTELEQMNGEGNGQEHLEGREGVEQRGIEVAETSGNDENGTGQTIKQETGERSREEVRSAIVERLDGAMHADALDGQDLKQDGGVAPKSEVKSDGALNTAISNGTAEGLVPTTSQDRANVPQSEQPSLPESTDQLRTKQTSPPRLNGDESKSAPESKLPSLLLRLGPALAEAEPPKPTSSLLRNAPMISNLPSRLPRVDTWISPDVRPPRTHTDSYVAPRSPSPKRYEGQVNSSARSSRRRDRSPIRVRHDEGRLRDGERSVWTDDSQRRVQRSPKEADHFPAKRRRTEGDGHKDEREGVRRESRDHRPRDSLGRHEHDSRHEHGTGHERGSRHGHDSRAEHNDSRHHHQGREESVERKPHVEDRASSEERRDRRRSDHRDDRRSGARTHADVDKRVNGDARRPTHEGDRRDAGSDRGRKDAEDPADSRLSRGSVGRVMLSGDIQEPRSRDAGTLSARWRIRSGEAHQRTRSPPQDDLVVQPGTDPRHQASNPTMTKEPQQSPRREYEGGKALSTTTPRNGAMTNGVGPTSVITKPQGLDLHAAPRGPRGDAAPNSTSTLRAFPYQQPTLATPVTRNQRPIPQSLSFNRSAFNNKPYARSATSGSNAEPLTARRGFETSPASAPPVAVQPINHVLKDTLSPPLQDKDYIISQYPELKNLVKPVWIENPKAPVANFLTGGKGGANGLGPRGPAYRIAIGRLGGKPTTRAKLPIVGHPSIIGIGDDNSRIQAEKLACLSALFQLIQAGLMKAEEQPAADALEASESPEDEADSEEVTQLSTGETITLRDARAFMDYYCKRFGFGQPEISYETVAMRAGPSKWEAIMEVGGKKIGLGAGSTKKMATRVCYLDVTSYLEKCDQALWREYLEYSKAQA